MGKYALSGEADSDIQQIARESVKRWGFTRAEKYVLGLHETFQRLADFPEMGRDASRVRVGYMQIESAHHSIFYRKTEQGILIIRILHERMDFRRHL